MRGIHVTEDANNGLLIAVNAEFKKIKELTLSLNFKEESNMFLTLPSRVVRQHNMVAILDY